MRAPANARTHGALPDGVDGAPRTLIEQLRASERSRFPFDTLGKVRSIYYRDRTHPTGTICYLK